MQQSGPGRIHSNYGYILNNDNKKNDKISSDKQNVANTLQMLGVARKYISRAIKVYEKHYGQKYNIEVIIEIIYRLKVKDKLKRQKRQQNVFESRQSVEQLLLSMDFSPHYVKKAIAEYKV